MSTQSNHPKTDPQSNRAFRASHIIFGALAVAAIGAGIALAGVRYGALESLTHQSAPVSSQPVEAQPQQVKEETALISRLIPDSEILNVDRLDMGKGTWMYEVDMRVVKGDDSTRGFVYLSADGTKILNGPLMDKRSKVMRVPKHADQNDLAGEQPVEEPSSQLQAPPQMAPTETTTQPSVSAQASRVAAQREQFMRGVEQLPYISTTKGTHPVYVLFDPFCDKCHKLYEQHVSIATSLDAEFRWVPIFNNEKSYPVTVLLTKVYNADHAKGLQMMADLMQGNWKEEDHTPEIVALTKADEDLVKPAAAVFLAIGKQVPRIGTPFVMFRNASNESTLISGVPYTADWQAMRN